MTRKGVDLRARICTAYYSSCENSLVVDVEGIKRSKLQSAICGKTILESNFWISYRWLSIFLFVKGFTKVELFCSRSANHSWSCKLTRFDSSACAPQQSFSLCLRHIRHSSVLSSFHKILIKSERNLNTCNLFHRICKYRRLKKIYIFILLKTGLLIFVKPDRIVRLVFRKKNAKAFKIYNVTSIKKRKTRNLFP